MKAATWAGSVFLFFCLSAFAQAEAPKESTESGIVTLQRSVVTQWLSLDGLIEAVNQGTISAQTQGRIAQWFVDVDSVVTKGQNLLALESAEQDARQEQAVAQLAEAQARVAEAARQYERVRQLFDKKTVSQSQYDSAEAGLKAATARVKAAEATLTEATRQLSYTRVQAPYAGIVTQRHLEVGELATPGKPLISGFSLEKVRVTTWVPQSVAEPVRRYQMLGVQTGDGNEVKVSGIVLYPYADAQNHQFKLRADLESGSTVLYPGTWVKVKVKTGEISLIQVPVSAVVSRNELRAVYVSGGDGVASLRQVRLGDREGDRVQVLSGLQEGEQIFLSAADAASRQAQSGQ
ncbi:MAG: efflux RND transporter periplasmic adaptor subunit [Hahellaceae bacterium]|nr:efflux RND transporter periplasmic adaptor subunit [Hahellaceae bacterium]